jgi:hypothetical protein
VAKVLRDEIIELEYHPEDAAGKTNEGFFKTPRLRKVGYQDEKNRYYEFLTNSFDITAEEQHSCTIIDGILQLAFFANDMRRGEFEK